MLFDALTLVSSDQAVTVAAVSEDSIDLLQQRDIGEGEELFMAFTAKQAVTAVGAGTVTFNVVIDDTANLATAIVIASSQAIGKAALPVGAQVFVPIPPLIGSRGKRYLGASYTIGTGPLTAGIFDAAIVRNVADSKKFYPTSVTVL